MEVVWFKNDLRIRDHEPLKRAIEAGPIVCLYILEDLVLNHPTQSGRQRQFRLEAVAQLQSELREWGRVTRRGRRSAWCSETTPFPSPDYNRLVPPGNRNIRLIPERHRSKALAQGSGNTLERIHATRCLSSINEPGWLGSPMAPGNGSPCL